MCHNSGSLSANELIPATLRRAPTKYMINRSRLPEITAYMEQEICYGSTIEEKIVAAGGDDDEYRAASGRPQPTRIPVKGHRAVDLRAREFPLRALTLRDLDHEDSIVAVELAKPATSLADSRCPVVHLDAIRRCARRTPSRGMIASAIASVNATTVLLREPKHGELERELAMAHSQQDNSSAFAAFLHDDGASERRDSLYVVLPITVIYVVIFFTGVIGNISTCVVIARNKSMHTATNYYLFSLAVSDLLLLMSGLPPEMYYIWSHFPYIFGEAFCIVQSFAAETSANATVLTITAFTVERYVAICHPFISHTMSKLSRAVKFVVVIWLLALCLAVPQAIQFGITYEYVDNGTAIPDSARCSTRWTLIEHAFEISTILFFVLPMTIITVLYVLIAIKLRRSRLLTATVKRNPMPGGLNHLDSNRGKTAAQRNVIRMLTRHSVKIVVPSTYRTSDGSFSLFYSSSIQSNHLQSLCQQTRPKISDEQSELYRHFCIGLVERFGSIFDRQWLRSAELQLFVNGLCPVSSHLPIAIFQIKVSVR
ncbi:Neuromedin-U receptor 2 [Harpegnathos saltator]|uniref:Neuromedin-U receptor 2 n=1 Tax=Harpegnathos saltator TaxID=610380 RepID=E2C1U6_HARSA|nr:Neuromedin-U receptor 2 [Harpegnathos saltator]